MSLVPHHRPCAPVRRPLTIAVLLLTAMALAGCTVRLIGDYDDTVDKGITDLQQRAELYFAKLRSNPATPFDQSFHDDVSSRVAVLKSRASALPKYSIIAQQIDILETQFGQFQTLDKITPRPITGDIVTPAESAVDVSIESILKLELALKRGAKPSG